VRLQNFEHILSDRTVAYLNVDIAVQGIYLLNPRKVIYCNSEESWLVLSTFMANKM